MLTTSARRVAPTHRCVPPYSRASRWLPGASPAPRLTTPLSSLQPAAEGERPHGGLVPNVPTVQAEGVPQWLLPHPWAVSGHPKAAAAEVPTVVATELASRATEASTKAAATNAATKASPVPSQQLAAERERAYLAPLPVADWPSSMSPRRPQRALALRAFVLRSHAWSSQLRRRRRRTSAASRACSLASAPASRPPSRPCVR